MVEIASFVLDLVKCLAAPIGRPFKYLYNYNTNFKNLETEVTKLKNTRQEVQVKVTAAERNAEEIKRNVEDWKKDVDSIIDEAEKLIQEKGNNPRCLKGLCPNLITRYKHSKKAFKLKQDDISQLLDKEFNEVSCPTHPPEIWVISNKDYLAFESRNSTVKNVWDALNDEDVYMIGVYGMGGLGKTTLVQEVGRKAMEERLFDEVVFIEVTETPNMETIQLKIAKNLGLELDKESDVADKAKKLYARVKMNKKGEKDEKDMRPMKILLILDNIWKDLDLKTLGIPSIDDRGGCKLLLTTRDRDVLDRMGSTNNFKMGTLNEEEAWSLFQKMAGDVIKSPGLNSLPHDVCKECGGFPIVICTIAKALRNKSDLFDWEDALRELRAPSPTTFGGLLEKDYQKIALSYKYLRSDELRKTFLISCLMGNDTSISDLFKHVVSLDILEGANLTMESARNRLDKVVRELKDSCLLLEGSRSKQFSMHDVIRAIAISIAYTNHHVFTERNDLEGEWKDKDKLRKCTKICLPGDDVIRQLWHEELDFPNLEYFYMDMSHMTNSFNIHENLFKKMPKLKVMNLFRMQLLSLPQSLDLLINLQTLCLDDSKTEDVAIIGKLKKLKVLSLRNANIRELPKEMGQLTCLRLLDLSNCWRLKVITQNVISKLSQLEELYVKGCHIQWKVEVLEELKGLSQLSGLEIDISDNKILPKDFFSKELKRYIMSIGDVKWYRNYWRRNYEPSRILIFKYDSTISLEDNRIVKNVELLKLVEDSNDDNNFTTLFNEKVIFFNLMGLELKDICSRKIWDNRLPTSMSFSDKLTELTLWRCRNIKYAFPSFIAKSLLQLQYLVISDCEVLELIVAKEEGANAVANFVFSHVTKLWLEDLPELTAFYPEIHTSKWPMLKELVVTKCDKFTSKHLSFQENSEEGELHISEPKSIFLDDKINSDLEKMRIKDENRMVVWQGQSKALKIIGDHSRDIPFEFLRRFENLRELSFSSNEYNQPSTFPTFVSSSYNNLMELTLWRCRNIKYAFPSFIAKSLVQLQHLEIKDCEVLELIVAKEEGANAVANFIFPHVTRLLLHDLPELIAFYPERHTSKWPMLKELEVTGCHKFTSKHMTFQENSEEDDLHISEPKSIFFDDKINSDLEEMEIGGENRMVQWQGQSKALKIISDQSRDIPFELLQRFENLRKLSFSGNEYNQPSTFPTFVSSSYHNLTKLTLWSCRNIKYAFPSFIAKSLVQLQHLKIRNCEVLELIIAKEEGANAVANFVFPHVTKLLFQDLPKLTAFYPERYTSKWPMLKELEVTGCDKFTSKHMSFQENSEEDELHISEPNPIFLDDEINSDLEELELENKLRQVTWKSRSKHLQITYDKSANIPLGLLRRFENLKKLKLYGNNQYKEIKWLLDLSNLEVLKVVECNKVMTLEPPLAFCQNLKVLKVSNCCGLMMKLMTPSMARSLGQLKEMSIEDCIMMIEIVENEGDATMSTGIVFNNLKKLSLEGLENLTCFCSGNYSFNFPSLEDLIIRECPNMRTFSQGILTTPKLQKINYDYEEKDLENGGSDLDSTIQEAHKEQVDSNLKELTLTLRGRDIMSIWEGEFQESLGEVKTLELIKDEYANDIPIQILHKFNSLEKLILKMSSYKKIFSSGEDEKQVGALTKLKDLELFGLFNLKCISKQDSRLNSILQNLDHLKVIHCHNLTTLLPSLASFENLRVLLLFFCNGMQNLMSSSTARSLVRLEELRIAYCEMMIEVLANEGDIEKGEIVFEKLEKLELYGLESLTCFCSGNYTLKFPFLKELDVGECSKMKTFFGGGLSVPKLQKLNGRYCSESDIDTIIQQLQNDCSELWERFP